MVLSQNISQKSLHKIKIEKELVIIKVKGL